MTNKNKIFEWGKRYPAPAKLNLMLRIVGQREDGYHLLQRIEINGYLLMLHLIFELSSTTLERLPHQTGVIFLNNAVFCLVKNSRFQIALTELFATTPCYVLSNDLTLRGIDVDLLIDGITRIDYAQFVQLTIEHSPIQTWT
jgi:sulfur relay protein TusB/DsrH